MNIAIIPARLGSKRILKKNIKNFLGKPMLCYPINAANKSKSIEKVFVTTDSEEIKNIAVKYGASVPFIRPKELSDDITPTKPVIKHAVQFLIKTGLKINNVCCIYPCTPLVLADHLDNVYNEFITLNSYFGYPILKYDHPVQRAITLDNFKNIKFVHPENELKRTQDLQDTFHDAGQFYWGKKDAWLSDKKMHSNGIGVEFHSMSFVDIDNENDWRRAELIKRSMGEYKLEF